MFLFCYFMKMHTPTSATDNWSYYEFEICYLQSPEQNLRLKCIDRILKIDVSSKEVRSLPITATSLILITILILTTILGGQLHLRCRREVYTGCIRSGVCGVVLSLTTVLQM